MVPAWDLLGRRNRHNRVVRSGVLECSEQAIVADA